MTPAELFQALIGKWKGTSKTWFEPEVIGDESEVEGEFSRVFQGQFIRHTYRGSMKGKPRVGEELLAYNSITKNFQISWVDDFHMSTALLFSQGPAQDQGFAVLGSFDVGENLPPWGWRTEFQLHDPNRLTITAYLITPEGEEQKATELQYRRVG